MRLKITFVKTKHKKTKKRIKALEKRIDELETVICDYFKVPSEVNK